MVAAIIGLAHEFGLATVAEGVETVHQLQELRVLGCDVVQGYYLARPGPPSVMTSLRAAVLPGAGHFRGRSPERDPCASHGPDLRTTLPEATLTRAI